MKVICETIAGQLPIPEACKRLELQPAMFYRLRTEVLMAGLARLEPRPIGRPPQQAPAEALKSAELQRRVEELEAELKIAAVREQRARVMPQVIHDDPAPKKAFLSSERSPPRCPNPKRQKHRRRKR
jgi:hypothetical protein